MSSEEALNRAISWAKSAGQAEHTENANTNALTAIAWAVIAIAEKETKP